MKFEFVTLKLTTALDVATDFSSMLHPRCQKHCPDSETVILLSTNVLWRVRLRLLTKLALGGVFSLTLFVIVIAIIRIAVAPSNGVLDLSWLVCWQGIEISVGMHFVPLWPIRMHGY